MAGITDGTSNTILAGQKFIAATQYSAGGWSFDGPLWSGGDNGTRELDALDTVDLQALQLARDWGVNGKKERQWTYTPCPRPDCGGAIVSAWNDSCILCARAGSALF